MAHFKSPTWPSSVAQPSHLLAQEWPSPNFGLRSTSPATGQLGQIRPNRPIFPHFRAIPQAHQPFSSPQVGLLTTTHRFAFFLLGRTSIPLQHASQPQLVACLARKPTASLVARLVSHAPSSPNRHRRTQRTAGLFFFFSHVVDPHDCLPFCMTHASHGFFPMQASWPLSSHLQVVAQTSRPCCMVASTRARAHVILALACYLQPHRTNSCLLSRVVFSFA